MLLDIFRTPWACRRNSLFNKLMPAVLQVFLVIGVWHILKSRETSDNRVDPRTLRSLYDGAEAQPQPQPCSPGDYTTGDRLSLDSILSRDDDDSASLDLFQTLVLKVELFVRDSEQGTLVVYPSGTPVTLGRTVGADGGNDKLGDNLEFVDEDKKDSLQNKIIEKASSVQDEIDNNVQLDYEDIQLNNGMTRQQLDSDSIANTVRQRADKSNINVMLMEDGMLRVRPEDQKGQQEIVESLKEDREERLVHSDGSSASRNTGVQMDYLQKYGGINFDPLAKNNIVKTFGNEGQFNQGGLLKNSVNIPAFKQLGQQQKIEQSGILPKVVYGGFQRNPSDKSDHGVANPGQGSLPQAGGAYQAVQSVPSDSDGEPLFTDGLDERIKKFKFEYFGRYINESHTTGNVVIPYVIVNPSRCNFPEKIDILYLINSIPSNSEQRQKIRDTFVASKFFPPHVLSYVFLVGVTTASNLQTNLKHESLMYGDIVQGNFQDTPGNSSMKGLMGLRWVTEHCSQVEYVMKIDDEVFVDSDKLLNGLLPAVKATVGKRAILCAFNSQGPISRVGLNSFAANMFPNRTLLRPYCKGYAVILTRPVISSLVAAAKVLPLLHIEDFYLYGILPFVAGGIDVYDLGNKRAFHDFGIETVKCYENMGDKCPYVASKAFRDRFTSLWQGMRARMSKSGGKWGNTLSLWHIQNYKRNF